MVDPGGSFDKIDCFLQENNIKEIAVLVTHAHFDHILALAKLKEKYGATVFVGEKDAVALNTADNLAESMGLPALSEVQPDILLHDEEIVEIMGKRVSVLHTPGHTKGSVCYIIDDILFSGDTLFRDGYGRTDFIGGSYTEMIASINKLYSLQNDYKVCPGHGEATTLFRERAVNPIL